MISYVRQFYATVWIHPEDYIAFMLHGQPERLYYDRLQKLLGVDTSDRKLYQIVYEDALSLHHSRARGTFTTDHEIRPLFMEPFTNGSLHTLDRLCPEAYVLQMALRKIVLPRGGIRESLTSLQQWLLLSIWRGKQFDLHFFLSEIEDVIANAISTGRQHMYPHIISYLLLTIDSKKNGPLYNESTYEVMTYMPTNMDDRCHGQRALRSIQELLPIQDRE